MNASKRILLFGTALFVLTAATLTAQEASSGAPGRDGNARGENAPRNAGQGAHGARAGHETQMLIGHAVSMAINGTTLKGQAEQAGKMENAGQAGAQGNQGQADSEGGQARTGADGDPTRQLMVHARKEIVESQRLLRAAGGDQASAQPLYTAADRYINTLLALCGESSTPQGAGEARSGGATGDAGRARTGRSSRDEDLGAAQAGQQGRNLGARDKAAVALINHSVCEVINGTHLAHMLQSQGAGKSAAGELLQRHAREMTSDGRETLQRFLGSSRTGSGGTGADNDQARAGRDAAQAAGGHAGDVSVATLARRGQELIEAFQAGAQGGSEGPGGSRRDREGESSGAGRSSDAESKTRPR